MDVYIDLELKPESLRWALRGVAGDVEGAVRYQGRARKLGTCMSKVDFV